jgi:peptidoglycan hydrolase CwlO-like protein
LVACRGRQGVPGRALNTNAGKPDLIDERLPHRATGRLRAGLLLAGLASLALPAGAAAAGAISRQAEAVRRLEVQIAGLDARYAQASAAYEGARSRLQTVRESIRKNTADLAQARKDFVFAQDQLAKRVSAAYRQPRPSGLEVLLRSSSLSEAINRVGLMERVQRQDGNLIKTIAATRERMRKARVQLVADQKSAKRESTEARIRLGEVRTVRNAQRGALLAARRQLGVMIAAEAQRRANSARLASLRAAQRRVVQRVGAAPAPGNPAPPPAVVPASGGGGGGDAGAALDKIAQCESGGNPTAVSPSGLYRGKYQFDPQTWQNLGGQGSDPATAPEAEQDRVAGILYGQRGASPWPVCGR